MDLSAKLEWGAEEEVALKAWHGIAKLAEEERDRWSESRILIHIVSRA